VRYLCTSRRRARPSSAFCREAAGVRAESAPQIWTLSCYARRRRWLLHSAFVRAQSDDSRSADSSETPDKLPAVDRQRAETLTQFGQVNSASQAAYAVGLLGFGAFIDRFGSRIGYAVSITVWSVAAIGHAAVGSIGGFALARAALGLGEGGNLWTVTAVRRIGREETPGTRGSSAAGELTAPAAPRRRAPGATSVVGTGNCSFAGAGGMGYEGSPSDARPGCSTACRTLTTAGLGAVIPRRDRKLHGEQTRQEHPLTAPCPGVKSQRRSGLDRRSGSRRRPPAVAIRKRWESARFQCEARRCLAG
jgi:hypothetical protein